MPGRLETEVLVALRETLSGDTWLMRRLAQLEPTRKLARLLASTGASSPETHLSSLGLPPGLSLHCSREVSGAQVDAQGDFPYATPSLPA